MFDIIAEDKNLVSLIEKYNRIIEIVINEKITNYRDNKEVTDLFNECAELCKVLGLHYGHDIKLRQCAGKFILRKKLYSVNLINIELSLELFISSLIMLYNCVIVNKNILFIIKNHLFIKKIEQYNNVFCITKWKPGTLTNSNIVLSTYGQQIYDHKCGFFNLIYSLETDASFIISKEVEKHNNSISNTNKKISLCLIADTDTPIKENDSIIPIILNNESIFFKLFVHKSIEKLLSLCI